MCIFCLCSVEILQKHTQCTPGRPKAADTCCSLRRREQKKIKKKNPAHSYAWVGNCRCNRRRKKSCNIFFFLLFFFFWRRICAGYKLGFWIFSRIRFFEFFFFGGVIAGYYIAPLAPTKKVVLCEAFFSVGETKRKIFSVFCDHGKPTPPQPCGKASPPLCNLGSFQPLVIRNP